MNLEHDQLTVDLIAQYAVVKMSNFFSDLIFASTKLDTMVIFNRELKHRRFWTSEVNRKSKLLLFDAYYSHLVENVKL